VITHQEYFVLLAFVVVALGCWGQPCPTWLVDDDDESTKEWELIAFETETDKKKKEKRKRKKKKRKRLEVFEMFVCFVGFLCWLLLCCSLFFSSSFCFLEFLVKNFPFVFSFLVSLCSNKENHQRDGFLGESLIVIESNARQNDVLSLPRHPNRKRGLASIEPKSVVKFGNKKSTDILSSFTRSDVNLESHLRTSNF